jgi:hypothetical protein
MTNVADVLEAARRLGFPQAFAWAGSRVLEGREMWERFLSGERTPAELGDLARQLAAIAIRQAEVDQVRTPDVGPVSCEIPAIPAIAQLLDEAVAAADDEAQRGDV